MPELENSRMTYSSIEGGDEGSLAEMSTRKPNQFPPKSALRINKSKTSDENDKVKILTKATHEENSDSNARENDRTEHFKVVEKEELFFDTGASPKKVSFARTILVRLYLPSTQASTMTCPPFQWRVPLPQMIYTRSASVCPSTLTPRTLNPSDSPSVSPVAVSLSANISKSELTIDNVESNHKSKQKYSYCKLICKPKYIKTNKEELAVPKKTYYHLHCFKVDRTKLI
jgi:hypothetical protein